MRSAKLLGSADGVSVLRLITRLNIGGPAIQALMLTKDLADAFPTVLAAGEAPPEEGELVAPDVAVQRIPLVRSPNPYRDVLAFTAIQHLIRRYRPRLVHTHMAKAGALGRFAAFRSAIRPKTVHTFHGHVLEGYFRSLTQGAFAAAERALAKRTDALVAVSDEVRDNLLALGIGRPEQWRVIPLGFDLEPFAAVSRRSGALRAELDLDDHVPLLGIMGRLAPVKDHALLFDAVARLPEVHLVVLGDGELRPALERRAREAPLAGRVHLLGWRSDVPEMLADLDVVALTSVNEGTPVTLIEALAAARSVIATDVGGVRAVVRDGVDGFLVRSRDPEAIAVAIDRLLSDPALRAQFGRAGRERVLSSFAKDRLIVDIRALYSELLDP